VLTTKILGMYKKIFTLSFVVALATLFSCSNSDSKSTTTEKVETEKTEAVEKEAPVKQLVSVTAKPDSIEIEQVDFQGIGKLQSFKGDHWKKSGNENYCEAFDMTIIMQSQSGDLTEQVNDYVDAFIDANKRDAPKYEVTGKEEGDINGVKCVRVVGKFDNGTAYVTRDYLFFTKAKVAILMARVAKTNESKLNAYVDYMASSYQK
jgi:uncharacterized protein YggL (DUF469 family)